MKQSTFQSADPAGPHVAIVMGGSDRWASAQGRRGALGHLKGFEAVRAVVNAAVSQGVRALTLFAFTPEDWDRPEREVRLLMRLLARYLRRDARPLAGRGVRLCVIGRRDRLSPGLVTAIEEAERVTAEGKALTVRIAVDYSSRQALLDAMRSVVRRSAAAPTREEVAALLGQAMHMDCPSCDVDLLIRTGGDRNLGDFLLWECAYAELLFTPTPWPDYTASHLAEALKEFRNRDRRFGNVKKAG